MTLRRALPCLVAAAIANPAVAPLAAQPRVIAPTPARDAEQRWIAFALTPGNQIRFTLEIDGRPARALLDTGVTHSVVSRAFAEAGAMPIETGGEAIAIGGVVPIGWTRARRLAIGGRAVAAGRLLVATLPRLATGAEAPIDALVGRDLIAAQAIDIDYAARRFRLLPSGRLPFSGAIAPLGQMPGRGLFWTQVRLGAARLRPMVVDTGDGSAITVTEAGWRVAGQTGLPTTTAIAFGAGGAVTSTIAIVPVLAVGDLVARHVEVGVEPPGGFSETIGAAGRIGSGFLLNYRVLLDPVAGRMVLRAGAGADRQPARSTSGLLLGLDGDRLRILHVMRGSPAERDGWRTGEAICALEGQPIPPDYATLPISGWTAGVPGRTVALTDCDGRARPLTLARFY